MAEVHAEYEAPRILERTRIDVPLVQTASAEPTRSAAFRSI